MRRERGPRRRGFADESPEPLEAAPADQGRRLANAVGEQIEGGADAQEDAARQLGLQRGHERFRARGPQPDQDEVGLGRADACGEGIEFLTADLAKERGFGPGED